ncbi:hypothetical protein N4845_09440 [Enterococcus faecalis]|nr:hypothetical protein [Enterococcus faecalis]MCU9763518.1 hypothetical protein [Enterococcus faecalis]
MNKRLIVALILVGMVTRLLPGMIHSTRTVFQFVHLFVFVLG